jgi:hypothetical protein
MVLFKMVMLGNNEAVEESATEITIRDKRCQILRLNYAGIGKKTRKASLLLCKDNCRPQVLTSHTRGKIRY